MRRRALLSSLGLWSAFELTGSLRSDPPGKPGETLGMSASEAPEPWGEEKTYGPDIDRVVISRGGSPDAKMAILASQPGISLPTGTIEFRLRNTTQRTLRTNPYAWKLWRWDGWEWNTVYPDIVKMPLLFLSPDHSLTFRLTLDDTAKYVHGPYDEVLEDSPESVTLGNVTPGAHAMTIRGDFPHGTVRFVSRFSVFDTE